VPRSYISRWVDAKPRTPGQAWLEGLEGRKREEAEFHDADRAGPRDEDPDPFIQLYRNLTPSLRTEWERRHVLGLREVRYARQWFEVENMRFLLLTAPLATLLPSGAVRRAGLRVAHTIVAVATCALRLEYWSWMFTFELVKVR